MVFNGMEFTEEMWNHEIRIRSTLKTVLHYMTYTMRVEVMNNDDDDDDYMTVQYDKVWYRVTD